MPADRLMEESLPLRSVERSVEELMLPAIELAEARDGREAEWEFGCRWATGWLHAQRRVAPPAGWLPAQPRGAPPASRAEGVLLFDASSSLGSGSLHVQALELALRRTGFRVLLLSVALAQERLTRAMRALDPGVLVLCGSDATLDSVGRLVYSVRQTGSRAPLHEYREAMPVNGGHNVPSIGNSPTEAVRRVRALVEGARRGSHLRSAFS